MAFLMLKAKVRIGSETANTAPITGISKASETVIQCTNSFTNGDIVVLDSTMTGAPQARNIVARVKSRTAANITLEGVNSTDWDDYVSAGNVSKIVTWIPFSTITNFSYAEPQPNKVQILTIHDSHATEEFGVDSPPSITLSSYAAPFDLAIQEVRAASNSRTMRPVECEFPNGNKMYFNAFLAGGRGLAAGAGDVATSEISASLQAPEVWYES